MCIIETLPNNGDILNPQVIILYELARMPWLKISTTHKDISS